MQHHSPNSSSREHISSNIAFLLTVPVVTGVLQYTALTLTAAIH